MSFEVPFIRPVFPASRLIGADFDRIVASNWFTNFGPFEQKFAAEVAAYMGTGFHAVTFNNATSALLAIVQCILGTGDGSKSVLVPSFTFAAGPAAIRWNGYRPLFIDIDVDTLQPSIAEAERVLDDAHSAVAGILLCNTFGIGNSQILAWEELAERFDVPLMVDSAAGFGSRYANGDVVGTAGTCEVFSFHATKPFAIGEGGAVITRDEELAARLHEFQNFGFSPGKGATGLGINGKLQEINAAIGLRQLESFDSVIASRQAVVLEYSERLESSVFSFPEGIFDSSVCFASVVLPDAGARDATLMRLNAAGVEARAYYSPPVHAQPQFAAAERASNLENTDVIVSRIISLPVHHRMARESIDLVIRVANEVGTP